MTKRRPYRFSYKEIEDDNFHGKIIRPTETSLRDYLRLHTKYPDTIIDEFLDRFLHGVKHKLRVQGYVRFWKHFGLIAYEKINYEVDDDGAIELTPKICFRFILGYYLSRKILTQLHEPVYSARRNSGRRENKSERVEKFRAKRTLFDDIMRDL